MNCRFIWIAALLLGTGSCRPLPSVSTFVDASSQMRKGVAAGFDALNRSVLSDDLATDSGLSGADEKKLKELARTIDKVLLGITAYAGALNNLVESGNAGQKNATQVAGSLTQIVDQLAPKPASAIFGLSAEQAAKLYGQIAKVRAANSLLQIMDEATPTVDTLGLKLAAMVGELIRLNRVVYQSRRNRVTAPNSLAKNSLDYERFLKEEQIKIFEKLAIISQYKSDGGRAETLDALKRKDPLGIKEPKDIEPRQAELVGQSIRIDSELLRLKPVTEAMKAGQDRLAEEYNLIDQLFRKSNDVLATWSKTHTDIRQQLNRKQPPNFEELLATVDDLKELREKIKALHP